MPSRRHRPFNGSKFLSRIETSSSDSSSSSSKDNDEDHHHLRQQQNSRHPLRRQRSTRNTTPSTTTTTTTTKTVKPPSALCPTSNNSNNPYSSIEYRAGTIYDCFSQKFCHFTELPKLIGTRIASSLQTDKNKRPSPALIQTCAEAVTENKEKYVKISDRSTMEILSDWRTARAKGAYILDVEQSQEAIRKYFELFNGGGSNTSNNDNVNSRSRDNAEKRIEATAASKKTIPEKDMRRPSSVQTATVFDSTFAALTSRTLSKSNLRFQSLDFPFQASQSPRLYRKIIDKRGPQSFSVASVFFESSPVLIEKNHPKRVFSFCGGQVVVNRSYSSASSLRPPPPPAVAPPNPLALSSFVGEAVNRTNTNNNSNSNSSFDHQQDSFISSADIGSVFLSASLPDEILILSSRWESQRLYQLFKIPSTLHHTGGAVRGQETLFRRSFKQGLSEPVHHFTISAGRFYLIGRRTIRKSADRVYRASSDIMSVAPGSLNNVEEDNRGLLVGLRDGRCGVVRFDDSNAHDIIISDTSDEQQQRRRGQQLQPVFTVFAKYENDPVISIGCCDLLNNPRDHVYVVTSSQRVEIWDLQWLGGRGRGRDDHSASPLLILNSSEMRHLDHHQHHVNNSNNNSATVDSQQDQEVQRQHQSPLFSGSSPLSAVSRFSFVPGGRCFFEYDFGNDAILLKRLNFDPYLLNLFACSENNGASDEQDAAMTVPRARAAVTTCRQQGDFVEVVAKWEQVSSRSSGDVLSSFSSSSSQEIFQQRSREYRQRQQFGRFSHQAFYGAVTSGLDFETKRPCCFVVDEVHQFAVGVCLE